MASTEQIYDAIVHVADEQINPRFGHLTRGDIDEKNPGDYVTVADRLAEKYLTAAIADFYPEALIVGEEAVYADPSVLNGLGEAETAFTIDPIDGTGNFVRGSEKYAVMVAQLSRGETVRSWIWQPQRHLSYIAERGAGVWRNGIKIERSFNSTSAQGACSWSAWHGLSRGMIAPIADANMCAGVDYGLLLDGQWDFLIYKSPKPWDHLPGGLMIEECGGLLRRIDGTPYGPSSDTKTPMVAAITAIIADEVCALLT